MLTPQCCRHQQERRADDPCGQQQVAGTDGAEDGRVQATLAHVVDKPGTPWELLRVAENDGQIQDDHIDRNPADVGCGAPRSDGEQPADAVGDRAAGNERPQPGADQRH